LGAAKGDEGELPDIIEIEVRDMASSELSELNRDMISDVAPDDQRINQSTV
jgi:hypothetical protein